MQPDKKLTGWARLAVLIACITPVMVLVAVLATRLGWISLETGLGLIALKLGSILAWAGLAAALLSVLLMLKDRGLWLYALTAMLVAGGTFGVYKYQVSRIGPDPRDVTTNADDVPGFGRTMLSDRRAARVLPSSAVACEGLQAIDSQLSPDVAAWALKQSGVTVMGSSPFRVDGWQQGMWFGIQHDVTVRIRPGRTDVRVAARDNMPIGPRACDLAKRVVAEMNALR